MEIVDRGAGEPLVLIPGLQGRWEYMRPAVDALARHVRVITFSLCDERAARAPFDRSRGIDNYVSQVAAVLDRLALRRATICGVSFGGVVALRFAAQHPELTSSLVLVSTPGPSWHLRRLHQIYSRLPWIFGPVFVAGSPFRLGREVTIAVPDKRARRRFVAEQLRTLASAPVSLSRMAARARLIETTRRVEACARVTAPTLVVHGEPALDHVVTVEGTTEYGRLIRRARTVALPGTGHLGSVTRPEAFAAVVREFLAAVASESSNSAA